MYSVTRLIDVTTNHRSRLLTTLRGAATATDAQSWIVAATEPGSRNGGDLLVHLRFADEGQWRCVADQFASVLADPEVTRVNGVSYHGTPVSTGTPGTVYRTLLLRVAPEADSDTVARFEAELRSMPRYVHTIRAWQLSRVIDSVGATSWTHVFEQEFTDVDGLMGPYLMHPIHWAVVDRWFDPETTDVIVRDRVCHSFCSIAQSPLS
ncbi:Dabb family protein [Mycolicibacterium brisbanense]|uniref:Stress responsive alpha-beta barrel n=1 Tax=Mycolicibacterium brisbanense TaxID=146020 RepID=A0A100W1E1_9MYCO|nr:Dabb family protein [Mycolicibacterium brisbanense]MCV7159965.1 Dabb family protein [Mycolicibacterium brisbanense]GAS89859.1 stress responsive alpha-beta barrel [Mycolicibacterium brisbanense]